MMTMLRNAWQGWYDVNTQGKVMAIFIAALLYCLFRIRKTGNKNFVYYGCVSAVLCVCPITAVGIMLYQTKFYDYYQSIALIPVIGICAFGMTMLLEELKANQELTVQKKAVLLISLLLILGLCSGLGDRDRDHLPTSLQREETIEVLEKVRNEMQGDVLLWAPEEVISYVRVYYPEFRLLYGRNMFDAHLNAYSYDAYSQDLIAMCHWMEGNDKELKQYDGTGLNVPQDFVKLAVERGVNCVVIPDNMPEDKKSAIMKEYTKGIVTVGQYEILMK